MGGWGEEGEGGGRGQCGGVGVKTGKGGGVSVVGGRGRGGCLDHGSTQYSKILTAVFEPHTHRSGNSNLQYIQRPLELMVSIAEYGVLPSTSTVYTKLHRPTGSL